MICVIYLAASNIAENIQSFHYLPSGIQHKKGLCACHDCPLDSDIFFSETIVTCHQIGQAYIIRVRDINLSIHKEAATLGMGFYGSSAQSTA